MPDRLPRPWHGASDREDDARVQALRLQRLEVDALLEFRRAKDDTPEAAERWQRLAALRAQRRGVLSAEEAAALPALPPAPARLRAAESALRGGWRRLFGLFGRKGGAH